MDPVTLVVTALGAGALKGAGESASSAVRDAYAVLRASVAQKLRGRSAAEFMLAQHADDPQTYAIPLEKEVRQAALATDPPIVELAQALMNLVDGHGSRAGKYSVDLRQAKGVQVGDRNTQTNIFS